MKPNVYAACKQYGLNRIAVQLQPRIPIKSILHAALYGPAAFEHADYSHRDGAAWKAVYEPSENTEITEKSPAMLSHQN